MGSNSGQQTTQQQTQTQPWAPAVPALSSILGNIQGLQGQSGINPTEAAAIQQLQSNTSQIPNFGPTVANTAQSYLTGDPFNTLNPAYNNYGNSIAGITNPNNLNPYNTPGFANALNTLNQDITQQVNGQFAAAGRSGSGYNDQTLARGLAQGEGSLLQNQYNTNVSNLQNAAQNYFNAGLGLNTAQGQNTALGGNLAGTIPGLATQGPQAQLQAGQAPFNLLTGNQGILAGLTVPIAGLGGQSQGTSNTQATQTPSLLSDILAGAKVGGQLLFGA